MCYSLVNVICVTVKRSGKMVESQEEIADADKPASYIITLAEAISYKITYGLKLFVELERYHPYYNICRGKIMQTFPEK